MKLRMQCESILSGIYNHFETCMTFGSRLEMLEHQIIGGEQANNENMKQQRKKMMSEAMKKQQRLEGLINS